MTSTVQPIESEVLSAMTDDEIITEIIALLRLVVPHEIVQCTSQSRLVEDIGIDSLGSYELMLYSEDRFGIEFSDEQLMSLQTLDDIVSLIRNNCV